MGHKRIKKGFKILSECPYCGNNEFEISRGYKVFNHYGGQYYPTCSNCRKSSKGKELENNLIEKPKELANYSKITTNAKVYYWDILILIISISFSFYFFHLYYKPITLGIGILFLLFLIAIIIIGQKILNRIKKLYSKNCKHCHNDFTYFIHTLKAEDLLIYDKDYGIDDNDYAIISRGSRNYNVLDIWELCESCKTCKISKIRVKSDTLIKNCNLKPDVELNKRILYKNNITKKSPVLDEKDNLTSSIKIKKTPSKLTAVYSDGSIGLIFILALFGTPFTTIFLLLIIDKEITPLTFLNANLFICLFALYVIYFFTLALFLGKAKIFIIINDGFLIARRESSSWNFKKTIKVYCSISIDEIKQFYVDEIVKKYSNSPYSNSKDKRTEIFYHLNVKTKDGEIHNMIKYGSKKDLLELEDYLEDYLGIEDKIVSDKEVLSGILNY